MGKRKERRLAAKTAANRRVKLDLLAEPSGEFGDSTNKEEVGSGGNAINEAGSPNSPSSSEFQHFYKTSGKKPENPLLLLGQYSDEDLEEEESSKEIIRDTGYDSPDEQVKVDNHESTGAEKDENVTADKVDQESKDNSSSLDVFPKMEENGVIEENTAESLQKDADAADQSSVPFTSDTQATGDVDSGWKMVLHEESNTYYYWNIVTGETSWEVPVVLGQGNESVYDSKSVAEVGKGQATSVEAHTTLGAELDASVATNTLVLEDGEIDGSRPELEVHDEKYTDIMTNDKVEGNYDNGVNYGFLHEGFATHSTDSLSNGEMYSINSNVQDTKDQGTIGDLSCDSYRLLQLGENLSERLKSLKGSEGFNDQISKLMFELDIRLTDIKSLVPYGSSLLPFWLHSENQLKKLEAVINNEILKYSQLANTGEIIETDNKLQENINEATTANENNDATSTSMEFNASDHGNVNTESGKLHENTNTADIVGPNSVEDEDMDVEMEVENELGVQNGPHHESRVSEEEFEVPPPPNDDWVPPPPPDDEPMPPPPPDEPPETSFPPPPSDIQTAAQAYSYNYTYPPGSTYEYYGQTNTEVIPNHEYYVDANGCQVAAPIPIPTLYYAPSYPDATSALTYYALQEGSVPTAAPVISTIETSGLQKSVPENIASTHAPETSTVTEPLPKVQPKVPRNKKRTVATVPGLRSNKKVSGLVDKWKAVKEELHEDEEDEPENALEVLEKKRQREIEQWHAQQIASGEAKENANFQPLGGDWRERVRRKRAKKSIEAEENKGNGIDDSKQQPDLVKLTKQLPSGWQAYWDESSKEVYYGNSKTSETTWIKPTI